VIKALGAIAPALVSREVYYPGAKYLVPILHLLIPGIDLVRIPQRPPRRSTLMSIIERSVKNGRTTLRVCIACLDKNNPIIQLCTTTFLIEISQYIKFGDLTSRNIALSDDVDSCTPANVDIPNGLPIVSLSDGHIEYELNDGPLPSMDEEDASLRESTSGFPDWIANFIRRVILLFDNLPEEAGGATEG
jgi:proteasome activator subunit 4